jgi:hypothetical protein
VRNKATGVWECPEGKPKACGDGLKPGVARDNKPKLCRNEADDADDEITCGKDKVKQTTKNAETGEWECPADTKPNKCGDGYLPGAGKRLADKLAPGKCLDESTPSCKDGKPVCSDGSDADKDGNCTKEDAVEGHKVALWCKAADWKEGDKLGRAGCADEEFAPGGF